MSNVILFPSRRRTPEELGYRVLLRGEPDWQALYEDEMRYWKAPAVVEVSRPDRAFNVPPLASMGFISRLMRC